MKKKNRLNICLLILVGLIVVFTTSCRKEDSTTDGNMVKDIDGNVYHTVTIGTQVWMVEELKTTRYNDGTAIPLVTDKKSWSNLTTPGYCWYQNDQSTYGSKYGALYNWYAVNTGNLCPNGWHIPTKDEWKTLEGMVDSLHGVGDAEWDVVGFQGSDVGTVLKAATGWSDNGNGTDDFGFSALPGGYRYTSGNFLDVGRFNFWWSSTESSSTRAWSLGLAFNNTKDFQYDPDKKAGFSVRCLRD